MENQIEKLYSMYSQDFFRKSILSETPFKSETENSYYPSLDELSPGLIVSGSFRWRIYGGLVYGNCHLPFSLGMSFDCFVKYSHQYPTFGTEGSHFSTIYVKSDTSPMTRRGNYIEFSIPGNVVSGRIDIELEGPCDDCCRSSVDRTYPTDINDLYAAGAELRDPGEPMISTYSKAIWQIGPLTVNNKHEQNGGFDNVLGRYVTPDLIKIRCEPCYKPGLSMR